MKLSKKVVLRSSLSKYAYFVANALGCSPFEVFYGDYKYNSVDGGKFSAILGSADFSECSDLCLPKLKFVQGNLDLNDTANVSLGVEFVGKNVFGIDSYNINLKHLEEVCEGIYLNDSSVKSLESLEKAQVLYGTPHLIQKKSEFVQNHLRSCVYKEDCQEK